MDQKKNEKHDKRKREIKILIMLGIAAFILMLGSLLVLLTNKDGQELPKDNGEQIVGQEPVTPNEGDTADNTKPSDDSKETDSKEEVNEAPVENKTLKPVNTSTTYVSDNLQITFEIPPSWDGLVDVYESPDYKTIEFLYKGETLFLSLRAATQLEYDEDTSYFNSFYKTVLKNRSILVLYSLPNEHPLAAEEGSSNFRELNAVMSDNYNLIKTVKAK